MRIAIPSAAPGGLDASPEAHFGHCYAFTMVDTEGDEIKNVDVLVNQGHEQGGCLAPVMQLKQAGVDILIAGGMGARPLAGFQQVGISVYFNEGAATVGQAVELVRKGQARVFGPAQVCGGGGDHGGGCGGHH